jgi:hypothetical protein
MMADNPLATQPVPPSPALTSRNPVAWLAVFGPLLFAVGLVVATRLQLGRDGESTGVSEQVYPD